MARGTSTSTNLGISLATLLGAMVSIIAHTALVLGPTISACGAITILNVLTSGSGLGCTGAIIAFADAQPIIDMSTRASAAAVFQGGDRTQGLVGANQVQQASVGTLPHYNSNTAGEPVEGSNTPAILAPVDNPPTPTPPYNNAIAASTIAPAINDAQVADHAPNPAGVSVQPAAATTLSATATVQQDSAVFVCGEYRVTVYACVCVCAYCARIYGRCAVRMCVCMGVWVCVHMCVRLRVRRFLPSYCAAGAPVMSVQPAAATTLSATVTVQQDAPVYVCGSVSSSHFVSFVCAGVFACI